MIVTIVTIDKYIRLIDIWGVRKVPRSPNQENQTIGMLKIWRVLSRYANTYMMRLIFADGKANPHLG